MAKNPNVSKARRQQFRRYRGPFRPGSDSSTIDPQYAKSVTALRNFWGERVSVAKSSGVSRAAIPEDKLGYVNYRGHAQYRPEHREDNSTPATLFHLAQIFPGARFVSREREQVLRDLRDLRLDQAQPEHHFVIAKTKLTCLRLYFTNDRKLWWFVYQEGFILKSSITYGSKGRALDVCRLQTIQWKNTRVFSADSS